MRGGTVSIDKTEQCQPRVRSTRPTRPGLVWDAWLGSGECDTARAELELKEKDLLVVKAGSTRADGD